MVGDFSLFGISYCERIFLFFYNILNILIFFRFVCGVFFSCFSVKDCFNDKEILACSLAFRQSPSAGFS